MDIESLIHEKTIAKTEALASWFRSKSEGRTFPIYSSFDIRMSDFKIAPVDANLFPAGFNNICREDQEALPRIFTQVIPTGIQRIGLLTEEHTKNAFYWDNVSSIELALTKAGYEVVLFFAQELKEPLQIPSAHFGTKTVYGYSKLNGDLYVNGSALDLVVSNNDFSKPLLDFTSGTKTPFDPCYSLGWHRRRKSEFFKHYNLLAGEFCEHIDVDPWHLRVQTEILTEFDVDSEQSRQQLSHVVGDVLSSVEANYLKRRCQDSPSAFIKNNSGTYGLGVLGVSSVEEVSQMTYKSRKKLKAVKGGGSITEIIVQEGIPTKIQIEGTGHAEPCLYVIRGEPIGGFLRFHPEKSQSESLNSPGSVFKRLCLSDLRTNPSGRKSENVLGWIARLAALATTAEIETLRSRT